MKESRKVRKPETIEESVAYRTKKLVTQYRVFKCHVYKESAYAVCPTCDNLLERCYQEYCCSCGQHLKWDNRKNIEYLYFESDEVGWKKSHSCKYIRQIHIKKP